MSRRAIAIAAPGIVLSQPTRQTRPSNRWPRLTSSIESAITSRLTSEAFMPSVTMGTEGMKASLVSREVIADSIELVSRGHLFDGLVCLVGCDKTMPGAAMAMARLDIPALALYNGTIYPGVYKGQR